MKNRGRSVEGWEGCDEKCGFVFPFLGGGVVGGGTAVTLRLSVRCWLTSAFYLTHTHTHTSQNFPSGMMQMSIMGVEAREIWGV